MNRRTLLQAAALTLAPAPARSRRVTQPDLELWYRQPARSAMNDALPIGNGRLGAVVFGGVERERLPFNEDSLWTGDANPNGVYESMGAYQAFGDLLIDLPGASAGITVTCVSGHKAYFPNEEVAFSVDGRPETKWCVEHGGKPVAWQAALPEGSAPVAAYSLTSCPDFPERDPVSWDLAGSMDGKTWVELDRRRDEAPAARGAVRAYRFPNDRAFRYYRLTLLKNGGLPHYQVAEITLGEATSRELGGYRRSLDLSTAIARTEFVREGVRHVREAFASHPAQVLVVRWTADRPGAISGTVSLRGSHGETTDAKGEWLWFRGELSNGLRYEADGRILARGGSHGAEGGAIRLAGCNEVVVLLAAATDYAMDPERGYRGGGPRPRIAAHLDDAARLGFRRLREEHVAAHRALFGRVTLDLGRTPAVQRARPTDLRKREVAKTPDPELEALLFQYGRYLLLSCSRPGCLPANLQGLWNDSNTPPWSSDYHANINVQMNYWPAEVANLPECHRPFFDLVRSQLPIWRKATAASKELNTPAGEPTRRGWALRTSHNTMGGMGWKWDKTANAWYCQHFWEHYAFGRDRDFLRTTAYPVLKETVEFWEDHLKALPDGRLVVPHGWSPEHGPEEDGVSYNQQIVWDLFTNYVEAARALGVDAAYAARVAAMREKLVGPKIGRWGQLQEWMTDRDDPQGHHRHTSHLFAVFPGRQIGTTGAPELAKAAKVSLDARGDSGDVREWSFAWRTALYARLRDAERAHRMVRQLFSDRNTCPNLLGLHPPMQMDGNFGITAGIAEMLLQSHEDELHLLPALPTGWAAGSVTGLRARGGFGVDLTWEKGALTECRLRGPAGGRIRLRRGERVAEHRLDRRGRVRVDGQLRRL